MYLHPVISRDLNAARRAEDIRRAAGQASRRAIRRSRPVRRGAGARAGPLLRLRVRRLALVQRA